jgi:hypothetical protein
VQIYDLLDSRNELVLREDHGGNVNVVGLTEYAANMPTDVLSWVLAGQQCRRTGSTQVSGSGGLLHRRRVCVCVSACLSLSVFLRACLHRVAIACWLSPPHTWRRAAQVNADSSRSHAVLQLTVRRRSDGSAVGRACLVDLAGTVAV